MRRPLYSLLLTLALPLIVLRLLWRGLRQRGYWSHVGERFGRFAPAASAAVQSGAVWIHAVSVGETRAAKSLVEALRARFPDRPILLTGMTPAGRETAQALFGGTVTIVYLPYDLLGWQRRLIAHFQPAILLVMETEIWPNLFHACAEAKLPALLVNARLSARSFERYTRYARVRLLASEALACLHTISAQSDADAERFAALGARQVTVNGNLKFDFRVDEGQHTLGESWRKASPRARVLLLASTREGEEAALLEAYQHRVDAARRAGTLLVVVPRHPQRFDAVWALLNASGLRAARRSRTIAPPADCDVWLGDSMGEMTAYFAMCDVAIVGGSFENLGGQNFIEACALGKAVVVGPHTFNFAEATALATLADAIVQSEDADDALHAADALLTEDTARAGLAERARHFAAAHRGATEKTMGLIAPLLLK